MSASKLKIDFFFILLLAPGCAGILKSNKKELEREDFVITEYYIGKKPEQSSSISQDEIDSIYSDENIKKDINKNRELLKKLPKPNRLEIQACEDLLDSASKSIKRDTDIKSVLPSYTNTVKVSPKTYQWCFFYKITSIEEGLQKFNLAETFNDTVKLYNYKMKGLIVLSKSLGKVLHTDFYYKLLRRTYIRQEYVFFNRLLEPKKNKKQSK